MKPGDLIFYEGKYYDKQVFLIYQFYLKKMHLDKDKDP